MAWIEIVFEGKPLTATQLNLKDHPAVWFRKLEGLVATAILQLSIRAQEKQEEETKP